MLVTLGGQNLCLLTALSSFNIGFAGTFRSQNHGALLAIGLHLLFHRLLNRRWRLNSLQLHTSDTKTPLGSGLVQLAAQTAVDVVTGSQCLFQGQTTHDVAKRCGSDLFDAEDVVVDTVNRPIRFVDLEGHDGIDSHSQVVFGDHCLWRKGNHTLTGINLLAHSVNNRDDEVQAAIQCLRVSSQSLYDCRFTLRDQHNRFENQGNNHENENDEDDKAFHGIPS